MEEIRGKEVYENCVVCLDLFVRITHVQNYSLDSRILCSCPGKKKKEKKLHVDLNLTTETQRYRAPVCKWLYCISSLDSCPDRPMNRVAMDT